MCSTQRSAPGIRSGTTWIHQTGGVRPFELRGEGDTGARSLMTGHGRSLSRRLIMPIVHSPGICRLLHCTEAGVSTHGPVPRSSSRAITLGTRQKASTCRAQQGGVMTGSSWVTTFRRTVPLLSVLIAASSLGAAQQAPVQFGGDYAGLGARRQHMVDDWVSRFNRMSGQKVEAVAFYDSFIAFSTKTTFEAITHALMTTPLTDGSGASLGDGLDLIERIDAWHDGRFPAPPAIASSACSTRC